MIDPYNIRIDRDFQIDGSWWVCDNPQLKVNGKLIYSPDSPIKVECHEHLLDPETRGPTILHGDLDGGVRVTLLRTRVGVFERLRKNRTSAFQEILGQQAIVGGHYRSESEVKIGQVSCHFENFREWFCEQTVSVNTVNRSLKSNAEQIAIRLEDGVKVISDSNNSGAIVKVGLWEWETLNDFSYAIETDNFVSVEFSSPVGLNDALSWISHFELLLSLLIGRSSPVQRFSFVESGELEGSLPLSLVWPRVVKQWRSTLSRNIMPFNYDSVAQEFTSILDAWFGLRQQYESVLELIASVVHRPQSYREEQFLTLAQALEGFCRIEGRDRYLSKEEFAPIREKMICALPKDMPPDLREKMLNKIGYLNDYTLRDRIEAFFGRHESVGDVVVSVQDKDGTNYSIDRLAKSVASLRNRLTHVESKARGGDEDMDDLALMLKGSICLGLLDLCGIRIGSAVERLSLGVHAGIWW